MGEDRENQVYRWYPIKRFWMKLFVLQNPIIRDVVLEQFIEASFLGLKKKGRASFIMLCPLTFHKKIAVKKPWLIPPHLRTFLADPISIWRPIEKEITLPMLNLNLLVEHTLIKGVKNLKIDFLRIYRDLRLSKMTTQMSRYNANHHRCLPFS